MRCLEDPLTIVRDRITALPEEDSLFTRLEWYRRMRQLSLQKVHEYEVMHTTNTYLDVRPARGVRLVEHEGQVVAYPAPHRTPVLPRGWAPLTADQQKALLQACDAAPECVVFRLGSMWEAQTDYRVYLLKKESWAGLAVATRCLDGGDQPSGTNRDLLGLGSGVPHAVRIALDFFNWDLEAYDQSWRLSVDAPAVPHLDPRRI